MNGILFQCKKSNLSKCNSLKYICVFFPFRFRWNEYVIHFCLKKYILLWQDFLNVSVEKSLIIRTRMSFLYIPEAKWLKWCNSSVDNYLLIASPISIREENIMRSFHEETGWKEGNASRYLKKSFVQLE